MIKVEKISVEIEQTAEMVNKQFTTISERTVLTNETTGDTYTINTSTYDRLKAEGKTDAQIFGYVDEIMRD